MLKFTRWISEYYLCAWGDVLKAALPTGMSLDEQRHWTLATADENLIADSVNNDPKCGPVMEALRSGPLTSCLAR